MFVDHVTVKFAAGKGGNGVVAWRREKFMPKGGPSGGNGGKGGSVILIADDQVPSLEAYRNRRLIKADDGKAGGASSRQGKKGDDLTIKVPCGTLVKDKKTGDILFDLTEHGQTFILCQGGKGGKGNEFYKTPTRQAPNFCTLGTPGQQKEVELELKLIADIGLVGFPNAGKSTFMSKVTYVPVKIAAYPFTTLRPNLGYIQLENKKKLLLADIPGIIEGAHANKGLGLEFLRHIERTQLLIYIVDASGIDGRNPVDDLLVLQNELKSYDEELLKRPFLVVLNKMDADDSEMYAEEFREKYPFTKETLFEISALTGDGIPSLLHTLCEIYS
ncbi:MAG: GTPase ObgE [Chlamydiales bacterium]|nr:GTPase ObgE [Chlamydiales bacterium]